MVTQKIESKNIYYPPGGMLLWIIIFLELITFGMALIAMVYSSKQEPELFHVSRLLLNPIYGTINTLFLLTSGFFMVVSVENLKAGKEQKSLRFLAATMLFGILFLALKCVEYASKIDAGLSIGHNTFFYFLLAIDLISYNTCPPWNHNFNHYLFWHKKRKIWHNYPRCRSWRSFLAHV